MARVLVLNVTFEPLAVVSVRRAVCLLLTGKVALVQGSGRSVRSERLCLDEPSVVRLGRSVSVPYRRHRHPTRRGVFVRDHDRCQYCNAVADTVDHIVPRCRGGQHTWDNVVAACRSCNAAKRDRLLADTPLRLEHRPGPPPPSTWIEVTAGSIPEIWEPYLMHYRSRKRRSA